ncbi:MAG: hypothetical protein U1C58_10955 [Flavobacteriaceae bacterium]|nr:hypothetical protein [Flavobacteriaceae bacterium]
MAKKVLVLCLITILLVLGLYIFIEDRNSSVIFNENRKITKTLVVKKSFTLTKELDLMRFHKNKLFFVNWNDGTIERMDLKSFNIDKTFGRKGEGPTENLNISMYEIEEESFFTYDQKNHTIQQVSFDDSLLYYKKIATSLWGSVKVGESFLLGGWDKEMNYKMSFEKYNMSDGDLVTVDAELIFNDVKFSGLIYHGFFVKNQNYEIYIPFSNDKIFVFDNSPSFAYSYNLIYDVPNPEFRYVGDELIPDRKNFESNSNAFLDDLNYLYILSKIQNESDSMIVDVYNIAEKTYSHSFKIPNFKGEEAREIIKIKSLFYVLYNSSLVSYEF